MPEQEFEIYLSLLSKLLRLNPAQKAAISDELRDHMEQRLADLIQTGLSREDAIKRAMDEFGDVTGLALDLTRVSKTPFKKVVVRSTLAASAVAVAVVCWLSLFAPEHRVVAPIAVHAQQAKPSDEKADDSQKPKVSVAVVEDDELFPEFLAKQTNIDFTDIPLHEACHFLSDLHDVPVMLHRAALNDAGVTLDTPISLVLKGLTFEEVLNHLTRRLGLEWEVDGGIVRITTADPGRCLTRQFDLRRLTKIGHSLDSLMEVLHLAADGWEDDGDQGTTALIGETVVVRQTYQNQRRIARVLAAIEHQELTTIVETCTGRDRLLSALRNLTTVEFTENPLIEALAFLSDSNQIPFLLDSQALQDEGVSFDTPITLTLKNRPLGKVLDTMFVECNLAYVIRDGVIRVTTAQTAQQDMTRVVYNIRDLAESEAVLTQLSDVIQRTTVGSWSESDGEGGDLVLTDAGGCLLVKQTDAVQFQIQTMLEQLRRAKKDVASEPRKPAERQKMVTKSYRMPTEVASDLMGVMKDLVVPESWKEIAGESPTIYLVAANPQMDEVQGVVSGGSHEVQIVNSEEKPQAGPPNQGPPKPATTTVKSIVVRPRSLLIIRQTPQMHREIQKFLQNLNVFYNVGDLDQPGRRPAWVEPIWVEVGASFESQD